jgi:hypothetical protein
MYTFTYVRSSVVHILVHGSITMLFFFQRAQQRVFKFIFHNPTLFFYRNCEIESKTQNTILHNDFSELIHECQTYPAL